MEPDLITLEPGAGIRLVYLAEGAANIVFRPLPFPRTPSVEADLNFTPDGTTGTPPPTELEPVDPILRGKLVRLRKNLPTTVPVLDSWEQFHETMRIYLQEEDYVASTLFKISPHVTKPLNAELRRMEAEGKRSRDRHGTYLAEDESYGTLITDMSPDEASLSFEFKPKWLLQSPSAPPGSKRCRTCALRAMRQAFQREKHGKKKETAIGFCPLAMVSGDRAMVAAVVDQLLSSPRYFEIRNDPSRRDLVVDWISKAWLLRKLRELQKVLDPKGILEEDARQRPFLTAMTLRDCTLFMKFPRSGNGPVDARLGDLDLKSSERGKLEYWQSIEKRLVDEGWYTATEENDEDDEDSCFLSLPPTP